MGFVRQRLGRTPQAAATAMRRRHVGRRSPGERLRGRVESRGGATTFWLNRVGRVVKVGQGYRRQAERLGWIPISFEEAERQHLPGIFGKPTVPARERLGSETAEPKKAVRPEVSRVRPQFIRRKALRKAQAQEALVRMREAPARA